LALALDRIALCASDHRVGIDAVLDRSRERLARRFLRHMPRIGRPEPLEGRAAVVRCARAIALFLPLASCRESGVWAGICFVGGLFLFSQRATGGRDSLSLDGSSMSPRKSLWRGRRFYDLRCRFYDRRCRFSVAGNAGFLLLENWRGRR